MAATLTCPNAIATYTIGGVAVCGGTLPDGVFPIRAAALLTGIANVPACITACRDRPGCSGAAYYTDHCYLWTSPLEGDLRAEASHLDVSLVVLDAELINTVHPPESKAPETGGTAADGEGRESTGSDDPGSSNSGSESNSGDDYDSDPWEGDVAAVSATGMGDMARSTAAVATTMAAESMSATAHTTMNGAATTDITHTTGATGSHTSANASASASGHDMSDMVDKEEEDLTSGGMPVPAAKRAAIMLATVCAGMLLLL